MNDSRKSFKLDELIEIKHGWAFKGSFMNEDIDEGPIVVAIGNFNYSGGFRFKSTRIKRYTADYPKDYVLNPGDILLAMTCQTAGGEILGIPGVVPNDNEVYLHNQRLGKLVIKKTQIIDEDYLYWLFLTKNFNHHLFVSASGTKILHTSPTKICNYKVTIPPIFEQKKIASILWNIQKKIELNNQINQTLEAMAQALFKSWFVDFEPVKAKIEAKAAGADAEGVTLAAMEAISGQNAEALAKLAQTDPERYAELKATAELFPDALVESELGEIPAGWEVKPLSQTVEIIGGGTPKKSNPEFWNGDIRWFSVKDAPNEGDVFVIDTELKITQLGLSKSSTKLLEEGTTIISARGTVGKLALVGKPTAMNQSCYGVKGINGAGPFLNYFRLKQVVDNLKRNTHGAVFDTITRTTFDSVFAVDTHEEIKSKFEKVVENMMLKIKNNLIENQHLSDLRDILLPKLLSGEISVENLEFQP